MLRIISPSQTRVKPLAHYITTVCSASTSYLLPSNSPSRLLAPWIWTLSSPFSHSSKQNKEDSYDVVSVFNRDPTAPPKLFVVQPRLRSNAFLQAKLNEALCLANSLEEQRDGYFDTDFFDKEIPPHVVVQNPSARGARAGESKRCEFCCRNYLSVCFFSSFFFLFVFCLEIALLGGHSSSLIHLKLSGFVLTANEILVEIGIGSYPHVLFVTLIFIASIRNCYF